MRLRRIKPGIRKCRPRRPDEIGARGRIVSKKLLDHIDVAAPFLALIGNEKRLAILVLLVEGEMTVGVLAEKVSLSQSALSQHLAKLRSLELVETRRERQMIYYSCRSQAVRELLRTLDGIFSWPQPVPGRISEPALA